ncbi:carbohydrate-binding family 9-like protein [Paenibacillus wulumuqiensis]|uniref:carbohydrate-binding family 9-like protein n=1 Tax=Paenibacillus wulumuqiensis TaxID=1567107 RepID=UPI000619B328|nr:carbohydrate-binding family 9-like protein [Paenibacillus wulumuqiensis]
MRKLSAVPEPQIVFNPKSYTCRRASGVSEWTGRLDQHFWQQAEWTEDFVDIEGDRRPIPAKRTRVKMLWDDDYFYIGAELEDNEIWANQRERDSVIFQDNDFEIFIDPDGDTHRYYEFEINALNTVWDLLLVKPYRDEGPAVNGWDISGLRTAVYIKGELNNPLAENVMWSVEIALPWRILQECSAEQRPPQHGEYWRVNFSRVEWQVDVVDERYVKRSDPATGKPLPEDNWVWSPQGIVNMHYPELWGYVIFAGNEDDHGMNEQYEEKGTSVSHVQAAQYTEHIEYNERNKYTKYAESGTSSAGLDMLSLTPAQLEAEQTKWKLRQLYYKQRAYAYTHGSYCRDMKELLEVGELELHLDHAEQLQMEVTSSMFQISAALSDGRTRLCIREDGWTWQEEII